MSMLNCKFHLKLSASIIFILSLSVGEENGRKFIGLEQISGAFDTLQPPWQNDAEFLAEKSKFGEQNYAFNVVKCDEIGVRRDIPDTRRELCKNITYEKLRKVDVSIIVLYHNEALSVLVRMINSLLDRTPAKFLQEILVIDDRSSKDLRIQDELLKYQEANASWKSVVKLHALDERMGLMRGRNYGASVASGEVLVFLDSHCEANVEWLEPLLKQIEENPNSVVCPIVDLIDPETIEYQEAQLAKGEFDWQLFFKWTYFESDFYADEESYARPYKMPVMSGGLFAIRKSFFYDLGMYDPGMETWGGENIEFSIRIWSCGGEVVVTPCSRVGHLFRYVKPYDKNSGHAAENHGRTVEVWFDEYKNNFYYFFRHLKDYEHVGIEHRRELRKKLNCKNFKWYLDNVLNLKPMLPPDKSEL